MPIPQMSLKEWRHRSFSTRSPKQHGASSPVTHHSPSTQQVCTGGSVSIGAPLQVLLRGGVSPPHPGQRFPSPSSARGRLVREKEAPGPPPHWVKASWQTQSGPRQQLWLKSNKLTRL